jgi:hypothetical protein
LAHATNARDLTLTALTPVAIPWLDGVDVLPE